MKKIIVFTTNLIQVIALLILAVLLYSEIVNQIREAFFNT